MRYEREREVLMRRDDELRYRYDSRLWWGDRGLLMRCSCGYLSEIEIVRGEGEG
jgi:hypothetical protein